MPILKIEQVITHQPTAKIDLQQLAIKQMREQLDVIAQQYPPDRFLAPEELLEIEPDRIKIQWLIPYRNHRDCPVGEFWSTTRYAYVDRCLQMGLKQKKIPGAIRQYFIKLY